MANSSCNCLDSCRLGIVHSPSSHYESDSDYVPPFQTAPKRKYNKRVVGQPRLKQRVVQKLNKPKRDCLSDSDCDRKVKLKDGSHRSRERCLVPVPEKTSIPLKLCQYCGAFFTHRYIASFPEKTSMPLNFCQYCGSSFAHLKPARNTLYTAAKLTKMKELFGSDSEIDLLERHLELKSASDEINKSSNTAEEVCEATTAEKVCEATTVEEVCEATTVEKVCEAITEDITTESENLCDTDVDAKSFRYSIKSFTVDRNNANAQEHEQNVECVDQTNETTEEIAEKIVMVLKKLHETMDDVLEKRNEVIEKLREEEDSFENCDASPNMEHYKKRFLQQHERPSESTEMPTISSSSSTISVEENPDEITEINCSPAKKSKIDNSTQSDVRPIHATQNGGCSTKDGTGADTPENIETTDEIQGNTRSVIQANTPYRRSFSYTEAAEGRHNLPAIIQQLPERRLSRGSVKSPSLMQSVQSIQRIIDPETFVESKPIAKRRKTAIGIEKTEEKKQRLEEVIQKNCLNFNLEVLENGPSTSRHVDEKAVANPGPSGVKKRVNASQNKSKASSKAPRLPKKPAGFPNKEKSGFQYEFISNRPGYRINSQPAKNDGYSKSSGLSLNKDYNVNAGFPNERNLLGNFPDERNLQLVSVPNNANPAIFPNNNEGCSPKPPPPGSGLSNNDRTTKSSFAPGFSDSLKPPPPGFPHQAGDPNPAGFPNNFAIADAPGPVLLPQLPQQQPQLYATQYFDTDFNEETYRKTLADSLEVQLRQAMKRIKVWIKHKLSFENLFNICTNYNMINDVLKSNSISSGTRKFLVKSLSKVLCIITERLDDISPGHNITCEAVLHMIRTNRFPKNECENVKNFIDVFFTPRIPVCYQLRNFPMPLPPPYPNNFNPRFPPPQAFRPHLGEHYAPPQGQMMAYNAGRLPANFPRGPSKAKTSKRTVSQPKNIRIISDDVVPANSSGPVLQFTEQQRWSSMSPRVQPILENGVDGHNFQQPVQENVPQTSSHLSSFCGESSSASHDHSFATSQIVAGSTVVDAATAGFNNVQSTSGSFPAAPKDTPKTITGDASRVFGEKNEILQQPVQENAPQTSAYLSSFRGQSASTSHDHLFATSQVLAGPTVVDAATACFNNVQSTSGSFPAAPKGGTFKTTTGDASGVCGETREILQQPFQENVLQTSAHLSSFCGQGASASHDHLFATSQIVAGSTAVDAATACFNNVQSTSGSFPAASNAGTPKITTADAKIDENQENYETISEVDDKENKMVDLNASDDNNMALVAENIKHGISRIIPVKNPEEKVEILKDVLKENLKDDYEKVIEMLTKSKYGGETCNNVIIIDDDDDDDNDKAEIKVEDDAIPTMQVLEHAETTSLTAESSTIKPVSDNLRDPENLEEDLRKSVECSSDSSYSEYSSSSEQSHTTYHTSAATSIDENQNYSSSNNDSVVVKYPIRSVIGYAGMFEHQLNQKGMEASFKTPFKHTAHYQKGSVEALEKMTNTDFVKLGLMEPTMNDFSVLKSTIVTTNLRIPLGAFRSARMMRTNTPDEVYPGMEISLGRLRSSGSSIDTDSDCSVILNEETGNFESKNKVNVVFPQKSSRHIRSDIPKGKLSYVRENNTLIRYFDNSQKALFVHNLKVMPTDGDNGERLSEDAAELTENYRIGDQTEIIKLSGKVVFSTAEKFADPADYIQEITLVERNVPRDFYLFYKFVSRYQIIRRHDPISFQTFLSMFNTNGLRDLFDKYVMSLQAEETNE